jgi:hypothetical protein
LQAARNWLYVATYAEDGKNKSVATNAKRQTPLQDND